MKSSLIDLLKKISLEPVRKVLVFTRGEINDNKSIISNITIIRFPDGVYKSNILHIYIYIHIYIYTYIYIYMEIS